MATKKLIAICRCGGEFETDKDGCLSYNGGDAFAIDIDEKTRLTLFKKELAETFECSIGGLLIKYFLPGNKNTLITISKDKDFKRMISFYADFDNVDVFITTDAAARNVSSMPASRSSRTTVSEPDALPDASGDIIHADDTIDMEQQPVETTQNVPISITNGEKRSRSIAIEWQPNNTTITGVGQTFTSFTEFREALRNYSIDQGFNFKYKKNEPDRVTVICVSQDCPWRIHVSRLATTQLVCIKTMNPNHNCEGASSRKPDRATTTWVGSIIKDKLKEFPEYKPKDIAIDIKREFGIELNYSQAYRAKESALEQLHGSYKDAYSQLPIFCEKLMETNPGSLAIFTTKDDSTFHRLFVSFHASVTGFQQGCPPLLFLNSIPLLSKYQGILLTATSADGGDGVFPVAFAVVDDETDDNWHWFLSQLKSVISTVSTSRQITFISDFQKGLKESLHEIFVGEYYHGYCLNHLSEKLNKDLKGQFSHEARCLMVKELYDAAYASKIDAFERCTGNIRAISPEAYNWVIRSEPEKWANMFFEGARYNHMMSDFGQVFYNWISDATDLPITQMVDALRGKTMELFVNRRADSAQWITRLTPYMEEKLKISTLKSRSLQVLLSHGGTTFEVRGESVEVVDIDNWDCSCKEWQIFGLPCGHAIAVMECLGRSPYDYCSRYFTVESYRLAYAESIQPLPNLEKPLKSEMTKAPVIVTPPPTRRPPGRPKMKQAGVVEVMKHKIQCSKCKVLGHNKRSCKCSP